MDTPDTPAAEAEIAPEEKVLPGDIVDEATGEKWSPARPHPETGVYMDGEYPHNHRLRAEALASDGKDKDPDGIVSAELIAQTKERLDRQAEVDRLAAEAEAAARPPVRATMLVADLEGIAAKEGVDLSTAKNNDDRVRLIEEARAGSTGSATTAREEA